MAEIRNAYIIFVRKPQRKRSLGYISVNERLILKWVLKKQSVN